MVKTRQCYCCCKSWQIRNNSANVAAILNPSLQSDDKKSHRKDKTCYCTEKHISPQLFSRPRSCIFLDDDSSENKDDSNKGMTTKLNKRNNKSYNFSNTNKKYTDLDYYKEFKNKEHKNHTKKIIPFYKSNYFDQNESSLASSDMSNPSCSCRKKNSSGPKNEKQVSNKTLGKDMMRSEIEQSVSSSSFQENHNSSTNRNNEERNGYNSGERVKQMFTEDLSDLNQAENVDTEAAKGVAFQSYKIFQKEKENFRQSSPIDLSKINLFRGETTPSFFTHQGTKDKQDQSSKSNLKQLSDFRKDYYFETHSTENLIKPIPPHICVHKFSLDDRFLPQPLHGDCYGTSRCLICDRPMENPPPTKIDERCRNKKGLFPKFYKYGLAPKKIYMGNADNISIEMSVDPYCRNQYFKDSGKKPNYFNTYALRYQKGVK